MSETVFGLWVLVVLAVLMNGCAGGVAAILHRRRQTFRRAGRIVSAAGLTGLISTSMLLPIASIDPQWAESGGPMILGLALAAVFVIATVISLPGAVFVARRLEAAGDGFRVFE